MSETPLGYKSFPTRLRGTKKKRLRKKMRDQYSKYCFSFRTFKAAWQGCYEPELAQVVEQVLLDSFATGISAFKKIPNYRDPWSHTSVVDLGDLFK